MPWSGSIGFAAPLLLWGLVALPLLWILLRAVPPAPLRRRFPGVALLIGLRDADSESARTPWWLLLLRLLAIAALIIGFAGPLLNPAPVASNRARLMIVLDGSWADAPDWSARIARAGRALDDAEAAGLPVALMRLSDAPHEIFFLAASEQRGRLQALQPQPWAPGALIDWAERLPSDNFDTLWLSDGIAHDGREALAAVFLDKGSLRVVEDPGTEGLGGPLALGPARFEDGLIRLQAARLPGPAAREVELVAIGPDPAGIERELAREPMGFAPGEGLAELSLDLPPELRNRIRRFELAGARSAAAVSLADDGLKRRKVALITAGPAQEGLQLLAPGHYLTQALSPVADLITGGLMDALPARPDAVILADVARLAPGEQQALQAFVEAGGLLLRFAGPRLAASDVSRGEEDPLLPVRLREGGRQVGGAMSWGTPRRLQPFPEGSPFQGLAIPDDVEVSAQILAQPDPDLAERTIAALEDGTPLVTRRRLGAGQVVLFHVTANADWSNLPLSGLFVAMLERLAITSAAHRPELGQLSGQTWVPERALDGEGRLRDAGERAGLAPEALAKALAEGPGPEAVPGLYRGKEMRVALNVMPEVAALQPARWPAAAQREGLAAPAERALKGPVLGLGLGFLMLDVLASLALLGRLWPRRRGLAAGLLAAALALSGASDLPTAHAQTLAQAAPQVAPQAPPRTAGDAPGPLASHDPAAEAFALEATDAVVLGHVRSGDAQLDELAAQGLAGLGERLRLRSSVEPGPPMGVDIETDDLSFFPFLYWPITADSPRPSDAAYGRLNQFLRTGGMILFDTRDADVAGLGIATPEAQALQRIAQGLDIPPLEPIPEDHVLTRSFYLLTFFPGRWRDGTLWVEAAPPEAEREDGMPFRNLNDGVTPVVIGGNDWAAAWAMDADGIGVLPIGRGYAGERQREIAYRFGINLIMHVLTGNYKSDQVHVPALLERLGE